MTDVERVARAICRGMGNDPDAIAWHATIDGPDVKEPHWKWRMDAARAAIEAMQEPKGGQY